jgi:hypothetical protein
MIIANTGTYDARSHKTPILASPAHAAAGPPSPSSNRAYFLRCTGDSIDNPLYPDPAADWQVREEGEYYIPDFLSDRDYEPDPELSEAAYAHSEGLHQAQAYLDEAVNLVAVLVASMEDVGDSRAMQAETVLTIVEKKLNKAHTRIDRHEARHRNLFLAYFDLKERQSKKAE